MIDIKFIRENPKLVKESQKKRGMNEKDVDNLISLDKNWRDAKNEVDKLRARRNKISEEINQAKKQKKNVDSLIKEAKEIPDKIGKLEKELNELAEKRDSLWREIPNIIDKSVPIGDVSKNKVIKVFGKPKKFNFKIKDHSDLLEPLDLLDTKKASEVAGSRFYYLKGDLVRLNYAIMCFALDFLKKKGFTLMQPPYMLRREILGGAIPLAAFEEMIYKIDGEDLYLIGTAEHALNAYHSNETINVNKPIRYAGVSPCFRKEAGAHGKDTKGIFRIHQFEKIEQFVFCKPEDSWKEFDLILKNSEELLKALEIPFRFVILSSGDTGRVPTKTVDFECWFPSGNCYRELGSCSNCLDYQARRSSIRYQDKSELKFVHTLNNTAIATERMIACLVENNQQKDGSIKIPKALWKYTGFKEIKAKKEKPIKKKAIKK
ncbi:MAG: serine--tRNA ligase [Candidatus Nanoarchaeia archaeon]|nr:serine--tRNA ligase [Candidatus Nanoarchaeia archaeon]MDD5740435.1 serine--tRNA ligase [Candidatus Nanoarchaeia archaeon]